MGIVQSYIMVEVGNEYGPYSSKTISRRRWMKTVGAIGMTSIAGCSSLGDNDGSGGGAAQTYRVTDKGLGDPPSDTHYNEYNAAQRAPRIFLSDYLAEMHYGLEDELFYPVMLDSWEYTQEEDTFTMTLKDTTWWHNDEPVTSQDLWTMCMLEYHDQDVLKSSVDPTPDNFEMVDEKTLQIHLNGETNPRMLEQQTITWKARPYSHFKEEAESIADNLDDEEHFRNVHEELASRRIGEPIGNSLWKITDSNRREFTAEIHEGHFGAEPWLDMEGATLEFADGDRRRSLAFSSQTDVYQGIDESVLNEIPDEFERFDTPEEAGFGIGVNMEIEPYDDVRVRKALMHIINRENVAENQGVNHTPAESVTGISVEVDTYIDDLSRYPTYETDNERATELLENAGLSREGNSWNLPDGSPWQVDMRFAPWATEMGHTVSGQLEEFGIGTELQTTDASQFWGDIWNNMVENEIEMWPLYWGGWRPYPINGLAAALHNTRHDNIGYPGFEENSGQVEVPMPIGNVDGDMSTINLDELFAELGNSPDTERNKEIFQTLAWVFNQTLPELPITQRFSVTWINSQGLNVPDEDSKHRECNMPQYTLPATGDITPTTE